MTPKEIVEAINLLASSAAQIYDVDAASGTRKALLNKIDELLKIV